MTRFEKLSEKLVSYIAVDRPIIYIHNFDFHKVDELISQTGEKLGMKSSNIIEYNHAGGMVHFKSKMPISDQENSLVQLPSGKLGYFLDRFITDIHINPKILVLKDIHNELSDPVVIAKLKMIAQRTLYVEGYRVSVIIVSSKLVISPELEKLISVLDMPLPERDEIFDFLTRYAKDRGFDITERDKMELSLAFKGLSEFEIQQILDLAYQGQGYISRDDKDLILREKEQSIKKSGLLEAVHVSNTASDIGGLEGLVDYLKDKADIYRDLANAIKAGVDVPKGILIVGMPGCGKSLTAKVSAQLLQMPLFRLDVGKLLGKYVGESEENLRKAIQIAEAATPCVLWIDEIEKAFAGVGKDEGGGGVTTRLFGYFLTWMQEKDSAVYVVATANDITHIPAEFLRKGRFDEMFSVNLPNSAERCKIFEIHLSRRKKNWKGLGIKLNELVSKTGGSSENEFSGADIESIVKTAIEKAFIQGRELEQQDLLDAINNTKPIAQTMPKKIEALKKTLEQYQFRDASERS